MPARSDAVPPLDESATPRRSRALVLGGGGFAASSWTIGLIAGMADAGVHVRDADLLIGTSAGARVAVELAGDAGLEDIVTRWLTASSRVGRPASTADADRWRRDAARARHAGGDRAQILRRIGQRALAIGGPDRRALVARQLPMSKWPRRCIRLIALNAWTGERRAFDRESGIDLVDAVMASTASLGFAPVWFQGQPYIDGGFHSSDNADLAAGFGRVLVLALRAPAWAMRLVSVEEGVAQLEASGAKVTLIQPDEDAMAAIAAAGAPTSPDVFALVTRAGRAQGRRVVALHGAAGEW